jgi:hypothetical protein
MDELVEWFRHLNGGVSTFVSCQQRTHRLATEFPDHAALFQLLSMLAGRFAFAYEDMPLPVDTAERAVAQFSSLLEKAAATMAGSAAERIELLNEISLSELGQ